MKLFFLFATSMYIVLPLYLHAHTLSDNTFTSVHHFSLLLNDTLVNVVEDYGAIPDDGNDDTQAINNALQSGKNVVFPDGTYNITSKLQLSSFESKDNVIYAENFQGAEIKSSGNDILACHYFYKIKNFVFNGVNVEIYGGNERNNSRYFESNKFINLPQNVPCIVLKGQYGPVGNIHIHHNRFIGGRHTVIGDIKNSTIEDNYSEGCKRNYEFHNYCENTIIRNNELHGGIVGIGFFCTEGGDHVKFGNIVENNQCIDQSEEGISFDNFGNRDDSYSRYTGKITSYESTAGKVTRLYLDSEPAEDLTNHSVVFVDDDTSIKGYTTSISSTGIQDNQAFLDVRSGPSDSFMYDNARIVVLSYIAKENKIRYNTVIRTGRTGIVFHGAGSHNLVEYNTVVDCCTELPERHEFWGGISIRNMNSANIPGVHGPSFYNTVRYNTVSGEKCEINAYNLNYGDQVFVAIGNRIYDNTYLNGAFLDYEANDNEPANRPLPGIIITNPGDSSYFNLDDNLTITANIENFIADSVELLINGEWEATDMEPPYEFPVTNLDSGSYILQVSASGASGDIRVTDHIHLIVDDAMQARTKDQESIFETEITLFPNPLRNQKVLNIMFPDESEARFSIAFMNTTGQKTFEAYGQIHNGKAQIFLHEELDEGLYLITIATEQNKYDKKLLVL